MKKRRPGQARDIEGFIADRQQRWAQLEGLLARVADDPSGGGRPRLLELMRLYRLACSDLNQARSLTANPELLGRLNQLVGRAYRLIYQAAPGAGKGLVARFFTVDGPASFRRGRTWVMAAAAVFLLGAAVGFAAVILDPANAQALIPQEFFNSSPSQRVAAVEEGSERVDSVQTAGAFGAMLYTHNIQVAFLTFAAGAVSILGAGALLFYNGLILGAVAAQYLVDGVGTFFIAWVGPHGALEIPAILFAGAAGMRLGEALLLPGNCGPAEALRRAGPDVCRMLGIAMVVLVGAGLIEGSFSQFSAKTIPYPIKITVAVVLLVALFTWLFAAPRRQDGAPAGRDAGMPPRPGDITP